MNESRGFGRFFRQFPRDIFHLADVRQTLVGIATALDNAKGYPHRLIQPVANGEPFTLRTSFQNERVNAVIAETGIFAFRRSAINTPVVQHDLLLSKQR